LIQRFNFYDVYGYLVPGPVLLAVFWLPFGLVLDHWPATGWSSALVALVFAYVAGHVLQLLAAPAFPHARPLPHDSLLGANNLTFSVALKDQLYDRIQDQFHINVRQGPAADQDLPRRRQDAFLLCRIALIRSGAASYAEQFQGMYALMRGVTAALVLGASNYLGWGLGSLLSSQESTFLWCVIVVLLAFAVLAFGDLIRVRLSPTDATPRGWRAWLEQGGWRLWLTAGVSFFVGAMISSQHPQASATARLVVGIGAGALLVAYLCYRGYRRFATEFAASVYRGFAGLGEVSVPEKKKGDSVSG